MFLYKCNTRASDNLIDYAPHNQQYVMLRDKIYRVWWMKTLKINNLSQYMYLIIIRLV